MAQPTEFEGRQFSNASPAIRSPEGQEQTEGEIFDGYKRVMYGMLELTATNEIDDGLETTYKLTHGKGFIVVSKTAPENIGDPSVVETIAAQKFSQDNAFFQRFTQPTADASQPIKPSDQETWDSPRAAVRMGELLTEAQTILTPTMPQQGV